MNPKATRAGLVAGALLLSALPLLQGCFPVVAAGVTTSALATFDRRSYGVQTDDEGIEWKVSTLVNEKLGDKAHVNYTSYNRRVLLSGEVPSEDARAEAERLTLATNNVAGVFNELTVGPASSFGDRSNDSFITSKVKSRFVDAGKFNPMHVKVVTEAGTVFLLGLVTQAEANSAVQVARTTSGVKKVVNLIEIITPAKARELDVAQKGSGNAPPPAPVEQR